MNSNRWRHRLLLATLVAVTSLFVLGAQATAQPGGRPGGGPGGGPNAPDKKIVKDFDVDQDGVLNKEERAKARESLKSNSGRSFRGGLFGGPPGGPGGRGPRGRGPGGPGGRGGSRPKGTEGPAVKPSDVKHFPNKGLYDADVLRTLFISFEQDDWEEELALFKPTDVEVPATLTVDGKSYPDVGVSFRGASSFFSVPTGSKRSLNLSMDYLNNKQKLLGYKTLNLLNCNGDASMMSSYLYAGITSKKIATPKVNFVKVVINGRSWGIYANVQQFNKDFLEENYQTRKGARWKVSGSPRGDAGLRYLGDDVQAYRAKYEIKSKDKDESWKELIKLCRVLNETPLDKLVAELEPLLDIDGTLWFLAADVALINSDGYWTRASDYSIYQDPNGKFHILPHDMNESFRASRGRGGPGGPGGPGFLGIFGGGPPRPDRGGPDFGGQRPPREGQREPRRPEGRDRPERRPEGQPNRRPEGQPNRRPEGQPDRRPDRQPDRQASSNRGYELDPLVGLSDRFPLRSRLLAVPELKKKYLEYIRVIARDHISWKALGPKVKKASQLIGKEVELDTRKLTTTSAFQNSVSESRPAKPGSIQEFSEKRSAFLLQLPAIKELGADKN